ncbi:MAG: SIMPL domain-containing protein, partial [Rikenellaceae bacterium]
MNGKNYIWAIILGASLLISVIAAGKAFNNRYNWKDTISVTGLGEVEFVSDLIVWEAYLTTKNTSLEQGYSTIESNGRKVKQYLKDQGIADSLVQFMFVNTFQSSEPIYNGQNYVGQRNTGYGFRQQFKVEGTNVDLIERVSREISTLIASGIMIESSSPSYFYTRLEDVKMSL